MAPFISIVIPCRNERAFIGPCLDSVAASDYPKDCLEALVVDGMSTDGTRAIVERHAAEHPTVALLDNPQGIVPTALNIGIRRAKGRIIVRLDAHASYPRDYLSKLVAWLERSGADNVGGAWHTRPANGTPQAAAIAAGLAHRFGVGNAHYRLGVREPRWVDTVPFGCYRREVFDRIGMFDEDLVRNQDDEFNARLIRRGGRILLVPDVVSDYFARESLSKVWRTYYQYGYFKPLAARKIGAVMTVRQLLPAIFVLALLAGVVLTPFAAGRVMLGALLGVYAAADLVFAVQAGRPHGGRTMLWLTLVFPALHVSYGLGSLHGFATFILLNRRPTAQTRAMAPSR